VSCWHLFTQGMHCNKVGCRVYTYTQFHQCAFHNHDSYGIKETCAVLGSVISISLELCLVVGKKKITPILMERWTSRGLYIQAVFGQNKIAVHFTTIAMESGKPVLNFSLYSLSPMSCAWWWREKNITLPFRLSLLPYRISGVALATLRIYRMVTRQSICHHQVVHISEG